MEGYTGPGSAWRYKNGQASIYIVCVGTRCATAQCRALANIIGIIMRFEGNERVRSYFCISRLVGEYKINCMF